MSLFAKIQVVLYPKSKVTEVYINRKENNFFSFDFSLYQKLDDNTLSTFKQFFLDNKITKVELLIKDDAVFSKSFVYDTKITDIEKSEVVALAQGFVNFTIDPSCLDFQLVDKEDKTIIQAQIFDKSKIDILTDNLNKLPLTITSQSSVSASIARIINTFYQGQYFFFYPLDNSDYTLALAKRDAVYLTNNLKGTQLDIQKIINYSNLYFLEPTTKIFLPSEPSLDINSTTKLDKTIFEEKQIAQNLNLPANLPLPVLGMVFNTTATPAPTAIINTSPVDSPTKKPMEENKKNVLPIIAVFILTAGIASIIFWYVVNRNQNTDLETPIDGQTGEITQAPEVSPTEIPTPTIAVTINKKIKVQVLNATEINGQAATLKTKLTNLGFTSVAVGNSPTNMTTNLVKMKASLDGYQGYFQESIGDMFPADYTTDLPETSTYDAVFYIGTDISGADTSVKTSTPTKAATSVTPTKKVTPTVGE